MWVLPELAFIFYRVSGCLFSEKTSNCAARIGLHEGQAAITFCETDLGDAYAVSCNVRPDIDVRFKSLRRWMLCDEFLYLQETERQRAEQRMPIVIEPAVERGK